MAETSNRKYEISDKIVSKEVTNERNLIESVLENNFQDVVSLLDSGVSPDAHEYNKQLFYKLENYLTPLHHAVLHGYSDLVKLLIEKGGQYETRHNNLISILLG